MLPDGTPEPGFENVMAVYPVYGPDDVTDHAVHGPVIDQCGCWCGPTLKRVCT